MNFSDILKNHKTKDPHLEADLSYPNDQKKTANLKKNHTSIVFRIEEIEQTNTVIHLGFKVKNFDSSKRLCYRLLRSRSMSEFVPFYTSEIADNLLHGCEWKSKEFYLREISRNDNERSLKLEVYEYEFKNEQEIYTFQAEFDFTLNSIKKRIGSYMNCYHGKFIHGSIKVSHMSLSYEFQFIDYIYGGCDMSTMVAMDCTIGNGDPRKPESLHHMPSAQNDDAISIGGVTSRSAASNKKDRIVQNVSNLSKMVKQAKGVNVENSKKKSDFNEYQEALYLCMSVLEAYDNDRHIPFLGFGAKLPPNQ